MPSDTSAMDISWSNFHAKFTMEEIKKYAPTDPGVYTLWIQQKDKRWKCFYCGKGPNLEASLLQHLSKDENNVCIRGTITNGPCGFAWAEIFNEKIQVGIQKFLYDHYKPQCNIADPGGYPTEVKLLNIR